MQVVSHGARGGAVQEEAGVAVPAFIHPSTSHVQVHRRLTASHTPSIRQLLPPTRRAHCQGRPTPQEQSEYTMGRPAALSAALCQSKQNPLMLDH